VAVFGREAAADIEPGEIEGEPVAHPVGGGKRPLVGVRVLDLAADMETQPDLVACAVQSLGELHGTCRAGAEFLRQLVGSLAFGLDPHEDGQRTRIDVECTNHTRQLDDLVLVIDGNDADAVFLQRQPDVRLRLHRMHVEHFGIGRDRANRRKFTR
jgi:hypothetical protein